MGPRRIALVALVIAVGVPAGILATGSTSARGRKETKVAVTFNEVAPIFFKNCAQCHREGEAAPMSLLSYKDARPWAKSIREKVASREMPPWHADPHVGQWANDRRLSQSEIETIIAWVDGGATEGDPKRLAPVPNFTDGWTIGKPDLVLEMPEPYKLDAQGPDEYQYFEIPTNFKEDRYVQMAEARPGNRRVVHHIIAFLVAPGSPSVANRSKEEVDKALKNSPFYREGFLMRLKPETPIVDDGCASPPRRDNSGEFLTGYAPGHNADVWDPGMAKKIPAGSIIRLQIHYSKVAGSVQTDRSKVGLVFAKEPPQTLMSKRGISNIFFKIPAGAENHVATACWTPKEDIRIFGLMPHMHYRGKSMEFTAFYPDGKSEKLLVVPHYSFAWQTNYILTTPKLIPKGTRIQVTGTFDNSPRNKFNPDPTKEVRYGEPTYDEMLIGYIDYVGVRPAMAKIDPKIYDTYAGKYEVSPALGVMVTRVGDRLFGQVMTQPRVELLPESQTKFFLREVDALVTFIKNDAGEVTELMLEQGGRTLRAKRVSEAVAGGNQK
jgi:mono/diheme cytochrome c family protein